MPSAQTLSIAALVSSQLIWSGFHVLSKFSFGYINAYSFPLLRSFIAVPLLFALVFFQYKESLRISRRDAIQLFICASFLTGNQVLFNAGIYFTTASDSALFQPATPVFTSLIMVLLKREKPSMLKALSVVLAVAGALVVGVGESLFTPNSGESRALPQRELGILCFIGNSFCFSIYVIMQGPYLKKMPATTVTFYCWLLGIPCLLPLSAPFLGDTNWAEVPPMAWVGLFYAGAMAAVVGYVLYAYSANALGSTMASMGVTLQPLFSCILGALCLDERLSWVHVIGGLFIIAGVSCNIYARHKEQRAAQFEFEKSAETTGPASVSTDQPPEDPSEVMKETLLQLDDLPSSSPQAIETARTSRLAPSPLMDDTDLEADTDGSVGSAHSTGASDGTIPLDDEPAEELNPHTARQVSRLFVQ